MLDVGAGTFAIERHTADERARVYVDVAGSERTIPLDGHWVDMETLEPIQEIVLGPFANRWIRATSLEARERGQ